MSDFKESFVVRSKGKKENEKEDEIKRTYHTFLVSESGMRINLHSEKPLPLNLNDEVELKMVKHQKSLKA